MLNIPLLSALYLYYTEVTGVNSGGLGAGEGAPCPRQAACPIRRAPAALALRHLWNYILG